MIESSLTPFLQLTHISDLHFGDMFYPPDLWTWVYGLAVHDPPVAEALARSINLSQMHNPVPQHLIATGDLTTWGTPSAFDLAQRYLRSQIDLGAWQSGQAPPYLTGLNTPNMSVVPGNHDMWGGASPPRILATGIPPTIRVNFEQFFGQPSPEAVSLAARTFPYQLRLAHGPVAVYLYGLDSTEVDLAPFSRWRNLRADGYVSPQQLEAVEALIHTEQDEPRIRIVALHHPLGYPQTTSTPWVGTLINLDSEVLPTLQRLGFALALCGHQHQGFLRPMGATDSVFTPIWVCSVGTSTQRVRLYSLKQRLLQMPYSLVPPEQRPDWLTAAPRCNEYRRYDLAYDPDSPRQVLVTVHSYRHQRGWFAFARHPKPQYLTIAICH